MFFNILEGYALPNLFPVLGPLLNWLVNNIGNIGWAVVVFTIIIKSVLLPLDYWQRAGMKKNNLKLEKMRPQLEKLKKQYAGDQVLYNQKMQALYKKEGYSMIGACLPTVITLVVFILVLNAFNGYLKYNLIDAYNKMLAAYQAVGEDSQEWAKIAAQYQSEFAPSFLWIKNVWNPDVPWKKALMDAATFTKQTAISVDAVLEYNPIVAPFTQGLNKANGYLILPILSAGSSLLLQLITSKTQKASMDLQGGQTAQQTNKIMMYMMPIMMGIFSITWTAIFAIYLVTSSLYSILTTVIVNKIVDFRFRKQEAEIAAQNARK